MIADGKSPKLFFSDFYNGITNMSETVQIHLDSLEKKPKHSFEVYAIDSWGEEALCFKADVLS